TAGGVHIPGHFLRETVSNSIANSQLPAAILLTGVGMPGDETVIERPGTTEYDHSGRADYAGANFRVVSDGAITATSILGDQPTGNYPLASPSKYYIRPGGVSGVHQAVEGQFRRNLKIYGFQFHFDRFGLSFLDSQNKGSRTDGNLDVPFPSQFNQEFERLRLGCRGELGDGRVPNGVGAKQLVYWQTAFQPLTVEFRRPTNSLDCSVPDKGFLALGVRTSLPLVKDPLFG